MKSFMSKHFSAFVLGVMGLVTISISAVSFDETKLAEGSLRPVAAVAELFTSQGCPSCAPSALLLKSFDQKPNVLALSWHIDYWDRFGWEDQYAEAEHGMRQSAYNKRLGFSGVYTPQVIYNGVLEATGTDQKLAEETLDKAVQLQQLKQQPKLSLMGDKIKISLPQSTQKLSSKAVVKVVYFIKSITSDIMGGENNGKRVMSTNVVRAELAIGDWDGKSVTWQAPQRPKGKDKSITHAAVLVHQDYGHGPIIGAAVIRLSS